MFEAGPYAVEGVEIVERPEVLDNVEKLGDDRDPHLDRRPRLGLIATRRQCGIAAIPLRLSIDRLPPCEDHHHHPMTDLYHDEFVSNRNVHVNNDNSDNSVTWLNW